MAELLKNYVSESFVKNLAALVAKNDKSFQTKRFTQMVLDSAWPKRELKARLRHVAECLGKTVSGSYPQQITTLKKVAPHVRGLAGLLFPDFVEVHGMNDLKTSTAALKFFTPYSSAEFAIRPFIQKYPREMMKTLTVWAKDKDEHVRRLSSEGCRPRLPWSFPLRDFKKDPTAVITILNALKDDPSLYVRKSVANNLNDISKDHPDLVLKLAKQWIGKSENTDWILKHALRTLLKKGDQRALKLFGLGKVKNVKAQKLQLTKSEFVIGHHLEFAVELKNANRRQITLRLEYAIHFLNKNGSLSKKVFKISEKSYGPGDHKLQRRHSLKQMTTRKHNPGTHQLDFIINGETQLSRKFTLKGS